MINKEAFRGKLITFEGIEGVGKSTQVQFLTKLLQDNGVEVLTTREPGGTDIAEDIRTILLKKYSENMLPVTELLLLFASRAQHFATKIKPALDKGLCVISDRFIDASYAYQGGGRKINLEVISALEKFVLQGLQPDLTFLLDMPDIATSLRRARGLGELDRIESEEHDFFERARQVYIERANTFPERFVVINANQDIATISSILTTNIEEFANAAVLN